MASTATARQDRAGLAGLRLYTGDGDDSRSAYWRISGHRTALLIWTPEEWEALAERPDDAQYHPCGVWCALRVL